MADDAGVAAEQAAPGALAGAAQIARRHDRVRTKETCASPCLVARMQLPGQAVAGSLQLWKPERAFIVA